MSLIVANGGFSDFIQLDFQFHSQTWPFLSGITFCSCVLTSSQSKMPTMQTQLSRQQLQLFILRAHKHLRSACVDLHHLSCLNALLSFFPRCLLLQAIQAGQNDLTPKPVREVLLTELERKAFVQEVQPKTLK